PAEADRRLSFVRGGVAGAARFLDGGGDGGVQRFRTARAQRDAAALSGQLERDGPPDAAARARHQRSLTRQPEVPGGKDYTAWSARATARRVGRRTADQPGDAKRRLPASRAPRGSGSARSERVRGGGPAADRPGA